MMEYTKIDVSFDFTTDTPNYWNNYWQDEIGRSFADPDMLSKKLRLYHKTIWSKKLPNNEFLELEIGSVSQYLKWKDFKFGSDSITTSFRNKSNKALILKVVDSMPNYREFIENYVRKSYTIGGAIIFPKTMGGINQMRGLNRKIRDRFDLTLECIRRYYNNEKSPLYETLLKNEDFFNLFVDFKGYVDFFFLQDLVNVDYSEIKFWLGNGDFDENPMPKTVKEYLLWMENQMQFVEKRNKCIEQYYELKEAEV